MATVPQRRSIRLKGYDYSQAGAYFVTLCTYQHSCLFGAVLMGAVQLNEFGRIAQVEWSKSAEIRQELELDAFVVMPNHLHGIVWIVNPEVGATGQSPLRSTRPTGPTPKSLGSFIAGYKAAATQQINRLRHSPAAAVWQRNYFEHIIRTERALAAIRQYIVQNPLRWELDRYNPVATGPDPQARELWDLLQQEAT